MKELSEYTDDDLREELKKRKKAKLHKLRMEEQSRDHWKYWTGIITKKIKTGKVSGYRFHYAVEPFDECIREMFDFTKCVFHPINMRAIKGGMPDVGDVVKMRYYLHKSHQDYIDESKITEVIKRKEE